jgi:pimeloyl-ACP methyl ester carboxylesterase
VWGNNDEIFDPAGAHAYLADLPDAELHLLDTGHFALVEDGDFIAEKVLSFLARHLG